MPLAPRATGDYFAHPVPVSGWLTANPRTGLSAALCYCSDAAVGMRVYTRSQSMRHCAEAGWQRDCSTGEPSSALAGVGVRQRISLLPHLHRPGRSSLRCDKGMNGRLRFTGAKDFSCYAPFLTSTRMGRALWSCVGRPDSVRDLRRIDGCEEFLRHPLPRLGRQPHAQNRIVPQTHNGIG